MAYGLQNPYIEDTMLLSKHDEWMNAADEFSAYLLPHWNVVCMKVSIPESNISPENDGTKCKPGDSRWLFHPKRWRSPQALKGSLNYPKKGTLHCQELQEHVSWRKMFLAISDLTTSFAPSNRLPLALGWYPLKLGSNQRIPKLL